ncbi:MAG: divalent-cation tolerance protein CutA [Patescibacteria group bacterium]
MYLIQVVCKNSAEAKNISSRLIKEHLAACVNFWPIESIYHWQGKVARDKEIVLLIKTRKKHYGAIEKLIKQIHSYKMPAIFGWPATAVEERYWVWLKKAVE